MAGRKPCIDSKIVEDEILKYKNDIVGSNKEIIPGPKDRVWQTIASSLNTKYGTKINSSSICVRVACNRNDLKSKLGLLPPVSSAKAICAPQDTDSDKAFSDDYYESGLHRCCLCKKAIHLFGCSVQNHHSEEGCGETRICLSCYEMSELCNENNSIENWKNKGKSSEKKRSAKSYLEKQPGFENIDLNKKGSIIEIAFIKNGSTFKNKPIFVHGFEKVLLSNTCSEDSILSTLAVSAAESSLYQTYLSEDQKKNSTAKFILQMLDNKNYKELYVERVYLLALTYITTSEDLLGNIKLIDTVDTAASACEKLLENMPSYIRVNCCTNGLCFEPEYTNERIVICLNAIDGNINLPEEINKFFLPLTIDCVAINCNCDRLVKFKLMKHIVVELVSIPKDFERSVDYAGLVIWKLDDVPKLLKIQGITFYLRGIVAFNDSNKFNLRNPVGHYILHTATDQIGHGSVMMIPKRK